VSFSSADPTFSEERLLSLLASCPLFSPLPEQALRQLAGVARRRRYEAGEALSRLGDPSDSVFLLCSGRVRASIRSRDGRDLVLHVAVPGEAPGYIDLIDESPRTVNAVTQGEVEVLVLPARAVRASLLEHPRALMQLSAELAGVVRQLAEAASDLVFLDLPARLAKLLLARRAPDGRVELGLTQSDLAAQLGVARQSLNRTLGELQRHGLIRIEHSGTSVELVDRMALRRLAMGDGGVLSQM
jgi:CRP/FNR family transcriptional regulator, cyclic AMP receptor protein